jgi:hypothetical protein
LRLSGGRTSRELARTPHMLLQLRMTAFGGGRFEVAVRAVCGYRLAGADNKSAIAVDGIRVKNGAG